MKSAHVQSSEETTKARHREARLLWHMWVPETLTKEVNEWPGKGGEGVACVCKETRWSVWLHSSGQEDKRRGMKQRGPEPGCVCVWGGLCLWTLPKAGQVAEDCDCDCKTGIWLGSHSGLGNEGKWLSSLHQRAQNG